MRDRHDLSLIVFTATTRSVGGHSGGHAAVPNSAGKPWSSLTAMLARTWRRVGNRCASGNGVRMNDGRLGHWQVGTGYPVGNANGWCVDLDYDDERPEARSFFSIVIPN